MKRMVAMTIIACLIVISLFGITRSDPQVAESVKSESLNDMCKQCNDPFFPHTLNSDVDQTLGSVTPQKGGETEAYFGVESESGSCQNELASSRVETGQGQIPKLPIPLPDGRIFLGLPGTDDAIPYIPTENPKISMGIPVPPLDLDD